MTLMTRFVQPRVRRLSRAVLVALLATLPLHDAAAARFPNLYEVTVAPDPAVPDPRGEAVRLAMAKLLMRVTGKREAGFDPSLQPLVQEPAAYLNASGLDREGRVVVRFNASLVEQALMSLNYPVWGPERPLTLLWIAADNGQGEREMLSANELASGLSPGMAMLLEDIQAQVLAVADERGLPIALPLLDVEDMTAVTFADVWGGFDEPVQRASVRYRPDAVLIVRVRPGAFGNEVQCLLLKGGGRNTLAGISLQDCLDAVADLYATEYSVIGGASSARLTVLDVATLGDYGRVVSYLETLTVLQSVDVESLERGVLTLRVAARGDAQVLERVLALGGVLAPAGDGVGVNPVSGLTFRVARPDAR
jgi:uncharacterized protein